QTFLPLLLRSHQPQFHCPLESVNFCRRFHNPACGVPGAGARAPGVPPPRKIGGAVDPHMLVRKANPPDALSHTSSCEPCGNRHSWSKKSLFHGARRSLTLPASAWLARGAARVALSPVARRPCTAHPAKARTKYVVTNL